MSVTIPARHDRDVADFVVPDKDWYEMEFTKYDQPVPSAYQDKSTGEFPYRIRLVFEIREEKPEDADDDWVSYDGAEVSGWWDVENNKTAKKSIYHVLVALGGDEDEIAEGPEIDDFLGKRCRGNIGHTQKPSKNDPTKILTFANVVEVEPVKRRRKGAGKDAAKSNGDPFS